MDVPLEAEIKKILSAHVCFKTGKDMKNFIPKMIARDLVDLVRKREKAAYEAAIDDYLKYSGLDTAAWAEMEQPK